ncbi:MAG: DUF4136 domain-containing protein [Deltaproteobacteria bacterium]|nr:DUF4136 domain-containing protein [Deltaproteobacteria bacterium]
MTTEYDRSANFGAFHTYAWRSTEPPATGDPRLKNKRLDTTVRSAVDRTLAAKGYQSAAAGTTADFLVAYHIVVNQKTSAAEIDRTYGYGRSGGWGGGTYGGWGWTTTQSYDYEQGTLLIDIIDPATMNLLWRGTGTRVIAEGTSHDKRAARITDAVEQILKDFPPH